MDYCPSKAVIKVILPTIFDADPDYDPNSNTQPSTSGNSKHTPMTSYLQKRQSRNGLEELKYQNDPCWNFTIGNLREMKFYSPKYQINYPRRIDCVKVIEAPRGKIVHLKFHIYFNMEEDINCKHNFLEVRDGQNKFSPEIGRYCGRTSPQNITSSHQYLWLRFLSDDNHEHTIFQVDYSFLDKPDGNFSLQSRITTKTHIKRQIPDYPEELEDPNDPCWKFTVGYPGEMEFYSPNYPENYPSRSDCLKIIEAPEGKIIRLDFRDQFFMEDDSECKYDSLEVRDGLHGYSYQIGKFCGSNFPDMITSSDRYLWLRFISDDSIEYTGFKAVYTFIDKPGDQNTHKLEPCLFMKNGSEGWVNKTDISNETLMLHQTYNEKLDCMFIISVKEGWNLHLQFLHYKMDKPNECDSNYIEVFPNVTLLPARVNQFCGSIAKTTIVKSNVSHIRFVAEPKAFNSSFAILWTAFRDIKKDEQCASDEFDCEDLTCIPIELKCNDVDNCRYRGDEDKEEVCIAHTSVLGKLFAETHMIAIVALFFIILIGMCSSFIYNCTRKLIRDHRTIKQQMAASRASRLDQVGKSCSVVQLSSVLPMSHSTDSSMSQHAECYVPETELMPILRSSGNTEELMLNDEMHVPEMRDSECQTRESLFHMPSFTPNSSGGDSFTPPPPPPPPSTRPPRSTPRSTTSPGFTTFGKTRQKASAEPRFRAEAVIELNKRGDSNKTNERPFSVQSTKSAPDVIVTH